MLTKSKRAFASLLLLAALPASVLADDLPDFCNLKDPGVISRTTTSEQPNWFFRPFQKQKLVSFSNGTHNFIFDLTTGKGMVIPGRFDPVPTPDDRLMAIPHAVAAGNGYNADAMEFYETQDLGKGTGPHPVFIDRTMKGTYQSIGVLAASADGNSKTIRMIDTSGDGFLVRDYVIDESDPKRAKVTALGSGGKQICQGKSLSLPMMSKDGHLVAAMDNVAHLTRIYRIDPASDRCEVAQSLHYATSKADFSPDGKSITYGVYNHDPYAGGSTFISVPSDQYVGNVYVQDLKSGAVSKLTNHVDGNSVFPAFSQSNIVYLTYPAGAQKDKTLPSYFVVADPSRARVPRAASGPRDDCADCGVTAGAGVKSTVASMALGGLWAETCTKYASQADARSAALLTIGMDGAKCRELAKTKWKQMKQQLLDNRLFMSSGHLTPAQISALTEDDLIRACPKADGSIHDVAAGGSVVAQPKIDPRVPTSCRGCHGTQFPFGDFGALSKARATDGKPLIAEMLRRIQSEDPKERMPMDMPPLADADRQKFIEFLSGR